MKEFNLRGFLVGLILGIVITFSLKQCSKEIVKVPVKIKVEVPVIEVQHDTIYEPLPVPYPVKKVDTELVEKYKKANDSLKQKLFENAVTINEYKETFEDSIQTITVSSNVTGKINSLSVSYKTKPRLIDVDTFVPFKVPSNKMSLTLYVETGIPTNIELNNKVIFKGGIDISDKKGGIYGISYDSNETVWGKIGKKFDF